MTLLVLIPAALLAMTVAAGLVQLIGPNRLARWLGLPPGDYE